MSTDGTHDRGRSASTPGGSSASVFDDVSVETSGRAPFTIAVVPDTQYAVESHPEMLKSQMRWLAANRGRLNMVAVLQLGDIVDVMSSPRQWRTARTYYGYLDGKVPFVAAAGNHDEQDQGPDDPPFTKDPGPYNTFLRSFSDYHLDGVFADGDYRNGYRLFTAGEVELLVLNLDFGASDAVLAWAGQVADAHPSRHVVVITHDYLGTDNMWRGATDREDRTLPHNYNPSLNDGVDMWNEFVRLHPNVQFVLNGHVIQRVSPRSRGPPDGWSATTTPGARSTRCSPTTRRTRRGDAVSSGCSGSSPSPGASTSPPTRRTRRAI